jgi:hypothetical protein
MALVDSGRAIGAVTRLLQERIQTAMVGLSAPMVPINDVTIGHPEPLTSTAARRRVNLFLYEVEHDGHLMNLSLDEGQPAPLWLVLHYLLTAFDQDGLSDTAEAYDILGEAAGVLHGLNFFPLQGLPALTVVNPLEDTPDRLKLTFDEATSDLVSRLTQGSEEHYRCSLAFQVRPVMIAPAEPPSYSLLVGVDYTTGTIPGEDAVHVPVIPSMGPSIASIEPAEFAAGAEVTVEGADLHLAGLAAKLGPVELPVTSQRVDRLTFRVLPELEDGDRISAGSHPLAVTQQLPTGRRLSSNMVVAGLLPRVVDAVPSGVVRIRPADPASPVRGLITITGFLLGTAEDEVYAALYRDSGVVQMYDDFDRPLPGPGVTPQAELRLNMPAAKAVPPGEYRLILRVNGRQARNSPQVVLMP